MPPSPTYASVRRRGDARADLDFRRGFTMVELIFAMLILSVVTAMAVPRFSDWLASSRVENAARVVAGDMEEALNLSLRQGAPVRIVFDAAAMRYRITDRSTGTVLHSRSLGPDTEFPIASATATGAPVEVYPNRTTSGSLTITLVAGADSTRVDLTSAGFIRVVPS